MAAPLLRPRLRLLPRNRGASLSPPPAQPPPPHPRDFSAAPLPLPAPPPCELNSSTPPYVACAQPSPVRICGHLQLAEGEELRPDASA
ncbi:hypothetical protein PR202_gb19875 [Eleusine coracana subsp. coracana]|uniref:Uncharacterized protein n=1 Tax=Eleusine coracana subsp. coracana TaxID=191504 RepID=A0AAV5F9B8_ELECO|nr:hypothetical protein PR202_gb19875 [Eleusine coracana subsp. coracana]